MSGFKKTVSAYLRELLRRMHRSSIVFEKENGRFLRDVDRALKNIGI